MFPYLLHREFSRNCFGPFDYTVVEGSGKVGPLNLWLATLVV